MTKVRVLVGTLAYGSSHAERKVAQKGDVIELSEEQLSKLAIAPAYPATVELVQEERKTIAQKGKLAEPPK
jgi:hypothetical protein